MASRAQITEALPETLPGDFVEWDEAAPSAQPVQSGKSELGPGIGVVGKPAAQTMKAHPAGAPGSLLPAAALSVSALDNKGAATALHPARSLNAALLSSRDIRLQEAAPAIGEHQFPAPSPNGARVVTTTAEFRELLFQPFRANAVEGTGPAERKWPVIAGLAATLVLILAAAMILIFNRGRVASVKSAAAPAPTTTTIQQPQNPALTRAHSKLKVSAPTPAATATREEQVRSEAAPRPVEKNAGPSPEQERMLEEQLHAPTRLQMKATQAQQTPPPPGSFAAADMDRLDNNNAIGTVFGSPKQPSVQIASQRLIKVTSGVAMGLLIQKTQPIYPPFARSARISGTVVLAITISKSGNVDSLLVVSGQPTLRMAAIDAVRRWHFKPYILDNQPTAIETTINLNFSLN